MGHKGKDGLTEQQQLFLKEYLVDFKQREAAIRAGYSEKTAAEQASRMLSSVKFQKALARRAGKVDLSIEHLLATLKTMMEFDPVEFINQIELSMVKTEHPESGGKDFWKIDPEKIPLEIRRILDIEFNRDKGISFKSAKRLDVIEKVGKILGAFLERHEVSAPGGKPIVQFYIPQNEKVRK